jgi:hypothetical protein
VFVLDATTRTLEVLLDAAPAANQLPVVVTYGDTNFGSATAPWTPGSSNTVTNGVTAVTAVAAPPASTQRQVEELTVRNDDTAARVVTLRYNDNGTLRKILTPTLQPGETLEYTHAAGLRTLAADGSVKFTWAGPRIANGAGSVQVNADGSVTASASGTGTTFAAGNVSLSYLTAGGVLFAGASGLVSQDGARLSWDNANKRLGVGTAAPQVDVHVRRDVAGSVFIGVENQGTGAGAFTGMLFGQNLSNAQFIEVLYCNVGNGTQPDNSCGIIAQSNVTGGFFFNVVANAAFQISTNNTLRWQVAGAGHLLAGADNAYDVGAAGATRPRSVYVGTSVELEGQAWVRNHPGRKRLTASVTNATVTFSNLTDLSVTLAAGRKYTGILAVRCSDSTAAEGIKFDFNGGTATMTSFNAGVTGNVQGATAGTTVSAALATAMNFTAMNGTGDHWVAFAVSLVCAVGGTFVPRFAQNSHSTGTATAALGGFLHLEDSPN